MTGIRVLLLSKFFLPPVQLSFLCQNKAQVLDDIRDNVIFFGDRCEPGGNDYPIVQRLEKEKERSADHVFGDLARRKFRIHNVKSYKDTWDILKTY